MSDDYDFYGKVDVLVDGLDLPQECFEASCGVCDLITARDRYVLDFASFGGRDAVVVASVFVGARQSGCPVPAEEVVSFVRSDPGFSLSKGFNVNKLNGLGRKFRRGLDGLEPVFLGVEDFIKFFAGRVSVPVTQQGLERDVFVSQVSVRDAYKQIVEGVVGVDSSYRELEELEVTKESFGYHGSDLEGLALHVYNRVVEEDLSVLGKSPQVLAASCLYIAGKLI